MADSQPLVVILDDRELNQPVEAEELKKRGKEVMEAEEPEEVDEDVDVLIEWPSWLPDGWDIDVRRGDNGSTYRYYTSPVSGYTFSTKMEALRYLFSEMEERVLESQACAEENELHRMHTWLPDGWVIEVRAGGEKMDKMYKFYVHLPTGMRFFSKEDVLRCANEGGISRCNVKGLCDTSSEDNILAQVEFNPDGLPDGWVKEIIFRKCNDGIRKDPYYTDPVSHRVFRTLKSVMSYLETGEITKHAYIPRRSVTHMYSFDKCTDLPQSMLKRLKVEGKTKRKSMVLDKELPVDQTLNHCELSDPDLQSEPEQRKFITVKAIGKEAATSELIKRPRGRPRKIMKQTNESTKTVKAIGKEAVTSDAIKPPRGRPWEIEKQTSERTETVKAIAEGGTSDGLNPQSEPSEKKFKAVKATGKEPISSETIKRPRGRPQKIIKQTNGSTSDRAKSSQNETQHVVVKKELGIGGGEHIPKTLEYTEMEKHAMVIQDVDNKSNIAGRSLLMWKSDKLDLVTGPDLHEQENGKSTEAVEKLTCSSVHKFYMRRSSNQTLGSKK